MTALKLVSSHDEIGNIRTFVFETGGLTWLAGQYQQYVLKQVGGTDEENTHFFTIASSPSEGEVHISTRVSDSKFKQTLNALQPGDEIAVHDLEGDFTWEDAADTSVVLVAGGIGVTPFRSMLLEREALRKPLSATLLYFTRDENIAFRVEFDKLAAAHSELHINYAVGKPITADTILELAPQASTQTVYLSGPESMVDAVGDDLTKRGISLKQDWFPGYDEKTY